MDKNKIAELLNLVTTLETKMITLFKTIPIDLTQTLNEIRKYIKQKGGE